MPSAYVSYNKDWNKILCLLYSRAIFYRNLSMSFELTMGAIMKF